VATRPGEGRGSAEIVVGPRDFERINRRYARYLKILDERPGSALWNDTAAKALLRWAAAGGSVPGRQPSTAHVQNGAFAVRDGPAVAGWKTG